MDFMPSCKYLFVVDTDKYSGNFEDELCAYMTGKMREWGHGEEFVSRYEKECPPSVQEWIDDGVAFVVTHTDDVPNEAPMIILTTPGWTNIDGEEVRTDDPSKRENVYLSVGIFLNDYPPNEVIEFFKQQARKFSDLHIGLQKYRTNPITIDGFRILEVHTSLEEKWRESHAG